MPVVKFFILLIALTAHTRAIACKPNMVGRDYTLDQLVEHTKIIVIAKVRSYKLVKKSGFEFGKKYDYKMRISEVLKGSKKLKEFNLVEFDGPESAVKEIGPGLDCFNHGGFKNEENYLIFVNANNSKAYRKIDRNGDPWLAEVKEKLKKFNKTK